MGARLYRYGAMSLAAIACTALGCVGNPAPLNLTSLEPTADQRKIADYYRQDAVFFRLKARELAERIETELAGLRAESHIIRALEIRIHPQHRPICLGRFGNV